MRHRRTSLLAAFVTALAVPLMGAYGAGWSGVPNLPMPAGGAMIYNAGNADYAGYRIVVSPSGATLAVDGAGHASSELQTDVAQKFFRDLAAAGPLDKLPAGECSTSATTGTTVEVNSAVIVSWNGKNTPALTCVSDPRAIRLLLDATTIQRALYVQAYRKRVIVRNGYPGPGSYAYRGSQYNGSSGQYTSAAGFNTTDPYSQGMFRMQPFENQSFNYTQFSSENFQFDNFHNEFPQANGVFATSLPGGTNPFVSLPSISPFNGTPFTGAPTLDPFAGYGPPSTNISNTSPFSASPFNGSPFSTPNLYSQ